ncbi:hypothetical protein F5Y07DRAFT_393973 [Xylaria sp. FL0933]|nr:hypothetical protein F5Y07DRAFT_393973 [Xylaria sp. FL0933]
MPNNELLLYVGVYPSGMYNDERRKYHWAFLVGPKAENEESVPGLRYRISQTDSG